MVRMIDGKRCFALEVLSIRLQDAVVTAHSVEVRRILSQPVEEGVHSRSLVGIMRNNIQNLGCLLQRVSSGEQAKLSVNLHHFLERLTLSEAGIPLMLDVEDCIIIN